MSVPIYLISMGVIFGSVLLIFVIRAFSAVQQAKARLTREDEYRKIAERAVALGSENATAMTAMQASLAEVGRRLGAIEKLLKEVE